jgi:hypothetical protein
MLLHAVIVDLYNTIVTRRTGIADRAGADIGVYMRAEIR